MHCTWIIMSIFIEHEKFRNVLYCRYLINCAYTWNHPVCLQLWSKVLLKTLFGVCWNLTEQYLEKNGRYTIKVLVFYQIILCTRMEWWRAYCKLLYFRWYQFSSNCEKRQFRQYVNSSFQDYQNIVCHRVT